MQRKELILNDKDNKIGDMLSVCGEYLLPQNIAGWYDGVTRAIPGAGGITYNVKVGDGFWLGGRPHRTR